MKARWSRSARAGNSIPPWRVTISSDVSNSSGITSLAPSSIVTIVGRCIIIDDEDPSRTQDPWQLVTEAVQRMKRNGDVMRSDRLKQVMHDIDPNFDEKDLGFSKFSRFCQEAQVKGLLSVTKLENGQLEIDVPARAPVAAAPSAPAAPDAVLTRDDRSDERPRRGRRTAPAPAARHGAGRRARWRPRPAWVRALRYWRPDQAPSASEWPQFSLVQILHRAQCPRTFSTWRVRVIQIMAHQNELPGRSGQ